MISMRTIFVGLACILTSSAVGAKTVSFPGQISEVRAPNGQLSVINENRDREPNHLLWIRHERTGAKSLIMHYNRHVDVSWSNDSRFVFINDYAESNEADCVIVDPLTKRKRSILSVLGPRLRTLGVTRAGHLYVTCTSWNRTNQVAVRLYAYGIAGRPNGVEERMLVDPWSRRILAVP